jgi:glycosyltransferase involved in cell wall biosynthesis
MTVRLAILVSHPIQHFAPWHREIAKLTGIDLKVFFCCDWGLNSYNDSEFGREVKWDVPLIDGYAHQFLPVVRRPSRLTFWQVDNPRLSDELDRFQPDVVKVFGYAYRSNWRAAAWSRSNRKPLMLYSDSSARATTSWWKRVPKEIIVQRFYSYVDGALFVGDNNRSYHERFGIPAERLFASMLPIDSDLLRSSAPDRDATRRTVRERHGIPMDAFVVMFCGKFIGIKRPLDLVTVADTAHKRGIPVWTLMVGDGPWRATIEDYARKNRVQNVSMTGFVNQSAIGEYYAASDAIAVTSSSDSHPLVVTEGGVFGLPTIASDAIGCIGANDTVRDGVNALVYPCGDQPALLGAISKLATNEPMRQRMSLAATEIAANQDVRIAAKLLAESVAELDEIGPR